ncbi:MAG: hypothetical protein VXZ72_02290 [Chlamydiota bacterium]|nr:hypothetical protein [Chlamydiota bacterium]
MFYEVLMEKQAKKEEKKRSSTKAEVAKMVAAGAAAPKLLNHGAERVLGVQRFTHGTSDAAAKKILNEGLIARHGGAAHGSSAKIPGRAGQQFVNNSKGRVHIFKDTPMHRRYAAAHANLAEVGDVEGADAFVSGFFGIGRKGTRVYGAMPYDRIAKDFELDPDYGGLAFRSKLNATGDIDAKHLSKSRFGLRGIFKNRTSDIKGYAKKNKGRFARGVGLLGASGLATIYAGSKAKSLYDRYREKKN